MDKSWYSILNQLNVEGWNCKNNFNYTRKLKNSIEKNKNKNQNTK